MEAATVPQPEVTESDTVQFVAQDQNLRLVKDPTTTKIDANLKQHTIKGKDFQFRPGADGLGHLEIDPDDSSALEFLRNHDRLNHNLADGGFYEQGKEPGRPTDSKGILRVIAQAVADGDREALEEIYVGERASESRKEVLDAAAVALEVIGADQPAPVPVPVHELGYARHASVETPPGAATPAQLAGEADGQGAPLVRTGPGEQPVPADEVPVGPGADQPQVAGQEAAAIATEATANDPEQAEAERRYAEEGAVPDPATNPDVPDQGEPAPAQGNNPGGEPAQG